MKTRYGKTRYTDSQVMCILKRAETGTSAPELCRKQGMHSATFYKWRTKHGGMNTP
ncbi:transposase [Vibrio stylophorae]|uniref:transposase n=1 Tax=Vibrio stylophorae TaxID=659351 RepID=UPI00339071FE